MSFTVSRLTHLADVTITAPIDGHYLRHNGMEWVNSPILAGDIPPLPGLDLIDAGTAFVLTLQSDSTPDFTADHTLTFDTADGARLFIISGDGAIDQDVRVAASPTFAGVTLSGLTATRLVATNAANLLVSSDIVNWIIGTANQVI
ncbi:MAG: hypothetical protein PHU95_03500, partial [Candidatus Thermoplasmatota archaeon]|nr:hypothetical protein [Candidatus Thermoplasmatota archaeon]